MLAKYIKRYNFWVCVFRCYWLNSSYCSEYLLCPRQLVHASDMSQSVGGLRRAGPEPNGLPVPPFTGYYFGAGSLGSRPGVLPHEVRWLVSHGRMKVRNTQNTQHPALLASQSIRGNLSSVFSPDGEYQSQTSSEKSHCFSSPLFSHRKARGTSRGTWFLRSQSRIGAFATVLPELEGASWPLHWPFDGPAGLPHAWRTPTHPR